MQKYSSVFSHPFHSDSYVNKTGGIGLGLDDDEGAVYGMHVEDILTLKVQSA